MYFIEYEYQKVGNIKALQVLYSIYSWYFQAKETLLNHLFNYLNVTPKRKKENLFYLLGLDRDFHGLKKKKS